MKWFEQRRGVYRRVYLLPFIAVKVGRPERGLVKAGAAVNRLEAERQKARPHLPLAPVLWCSPSGRVLIMRRARPVDARAFAGETRMLAAWESLVSAGLPVEPKDSSFGTIGDRVVAVDYGDYSHASASRECYEKYGWVEGA